MINAKSHSIWIFFYLPKKAALADWKKVNVGMMIIIAEGLIWAGTAETIQSDTEKLIK